MAAVVTRWCVMMPWLAAIAGVAPLLLWGFPLGHDWIYELVRVAEYQTAIGSGQFPPYWAENLYGGYGSPVFVFYAPLFGATSSALGWLASNAATGASLCLVFFSLAAVPIVRRALDSLLMGDAKGVAGPREALLAAAARVGVGVYVLHPYLLGDKLVRNANAEFVALCVLPAVVHGVAIADRQPRRAAAWLSAGLALCVLAHNLTALVAMSLALAAAGVLHGTRAARSTWRVLALAIVAGLALSFFFWFPALVLSPLVRTEELLHGKFDFHSQFPAPWSVFGYARFYATGWVTPAVLGLGAVLVATRGRNRQGERFVLSPRAWRAFVAALAAAAGLLLLLQPLPPVVWLWEHVPFMAYLQFPWRLLGPLALMCAVVAAGSFAILLDGRRARLRVAVEIAVWLVCLANAAPRLADYAPLPPAVKANLVAALAPQSIRSKGYSVTVGDEYLPRHATPSAWREHRPVIGPVVSLPGGASVEVIRDEARAIALGVEAPGEARLRVARWSFPGWSLRIDGEVGVVGTAEMGAVEVRVPAGARRVDLELGAPQVRRWGIAVSALSLALWGALLARRWGPFG